MKKTKGRDEQKGRGIMSFYETEKDAWQNIDYGWLIVCMGWIDLVLEPFFPMQREEVVSYDQKNNFSIFLSILSK